MVVTVVWCYAARHLLWHCCGLTEASQHCPLATFLWYLLTWCDINWPNSNLMCSADSIDCSLTCQQCHRRFQRPHTSLEQNKKQGGRRWRLWMDGQKRTWGGEAQVLLVEQEFRAGVCHLLELASYSSRAASVTLNPPPLLSPSTSP